MVFCQVLFYGVLFLLNCKIFPTSLILCWFPYFYKYSCCFLGMTKNTQYTNKLYIIYNVGTQLCTAETSYKPLYKSLDVFYKVIYNIYSIAYNTLIRAYISFMDVVASCFVEPYRVFTSVRILQYTFQYLFV